MKRKSQAKQAPIPFVPKCLECQVPLPERLFAYEASATAVAWSPDGRLIASGDEARVEVRDAENGAIVGIYSGHSQPVELLRWAPNGRWIASYDQQRQIQVWEVTSLQRLNESLFHTARVRALAWSPSSTHIVSAAANGVICAWSALT